MQTFLPYEDSVQSAAVLDNARLRKQQIECIQILNTILNKSDAWKNHPAVLMWKGFHVGLSLYGLAIAHQCEKRSYISHRSLFEQHIENGLPNTENLWPKWLGLRAFHASHRSKLLWKGRVDAVCYSLRDLLNVRSINEWLGKNGYNDKNLLNLEEVKRLEDLATSMTSKPLRINHYLQFKWTEPDNLPYYWPTKNGF